jgi:type IV pilus assembly protein PilB
MDAEGRQVDIRVATTPVLGGEKVVLRLLDTSRPLLRLEQLGTSTDVSTRHSALLRAPYGTMICSGPTGNVKTTTLHAVCSRRLTCHELTTRRGVIPGRVRSAQR